MFYANQKIMSKSISDKQKKRGRGRPATGIRPMVGFRLSAEEIARVDAWAGHHGMSRSDALRAMVMEALDRELRGRGKQR
jgi:Ribbon-helix-helix protein, copG family